MSTLTEYLSLGIFAEDQPERWTSEYTVEVPAGQDDLSNYVTLNLWNSGNNLANFGYMSSQGFTTNYNGWYIDDTDIFDFGDEDFTVRLQFGLGSYYAYNELEGQSTIPVLCMGPGQVYDSPFLVAMTNPGATSNVQKGDLFFSLRDTADNEAYCYLSSSDWYLPTYASKFHMEISRRGSVFSLRYNGLYGQKEVNNTFASFGSLDISGMTRSYIMSSPITGSVNNAFYGLQITKGISRTVGPNCIGKYAKTFGYPNQPMIRRRHSEDLMCKNLVVPVVGLRATPPALSVVADTGACANDETANGNVLTNDSGQYLRVTKVSGSVNSVGVEVAGSAGGLFTIDARGNWTFDPDSDFGSLTGEQTATTSVTYHVSDGVSEASATLTVTVSATGAETDPMWADVVLLIQAPESGSTIDDAKGHTVSAGGGTAVSTSLGYPTIYFDGNGDDLLVGAAGDFNLLHDGSTWTIDFIFRPSRVATDNTILCTNGGSTSNRGLFLAFNSDKLQMFTSNGSTYVVGSASVSARTFSYSFTPGTEYHVAIDYDLSRASNHARLYVDGVHVASLAKTANAPSTANSLQMLVGLFSRSYPAYAYQGHMRAIRITPGLRDASTPPTWPYPEA